MAQMDPKKDKRFLKFLEGLKVLVVDPTPSSRNGLRKVISNFGLRGPQIDAAENFSDAVEKIEKGGINCIFFEYELEKHSGFELMEAMRKKVQNPLGIMTFLVSSRNTAAMVSRAAEENIDSILLKPLTADSVAKEFHRVAEDKIDPSPYLQNISAGQELIVAQKYEEALPVFQGIISAPNPPAKAFYHIGFIHHATGKPDLAEANFNLALKIDPDHYLTLCHLFDLQYQKKNYIDAYKIAIRILEKHPISPKKLPELVRLAIVNDSVGDIENYFKIFSGLEIVERDEQLTMSIAAGLVTCGRYLIRKNEKQKATEAFNKAVTISVGRRSIYLGILRALMAEKLVNDAEVWFGMVPVEFKDDSELQSINFQIFVAKGMDAEVIKLGTELKARGSKDFFVFESVIKSSLKMGRRDSVVEEMITEVTRVFPEKSEQIKVLVGNMKGKAAA